jgi:hypothetical protein
MCSLIIPAEVAARMEREGEAFRKTADEQADPESINVTGGATVDQEGLANNFAIEPEMYVNQPGDLRQQEEELAAERTQAIAEMKQEKEGELTAEGDTRGKGSGII